MDAKQERDEKVLNLAREVVMRGVLGGQMSPDNPEHCVIVAGAILIVAASAAGISIDDAVARATNIPFEVAERLTESVNKSDGHFGTYL